MPTVVGETSGGDPIFEVRSVRLVLRPDATHFNRIAACSKCGRDVPGAAVLSSADLDLVPHPVICKSCVSTAGSPMFETERRRPLAPAPSPPEVTAVNGSASGSPAAAPADDALVEALRSELLAAVDDRIAQLHSGPQPQAVGRDEWDEMVGRVDHIAELLLQDPAGRSRIQDLEERVQRLQTGLHTGLARVQSDDVTLAQARGDVTRLEDRLTGRLAGLAAGIVTQRREILALIEEGLHGVGERVQELRASVDDGAVRAEAGSALLERATEELARLGDQLNERLDRLSERTARTEPVENERLDAVEQHLDEAVATAAERLQALEEWTVLATEADTQRLRVIEQHLDEASERLAQALESQRVELRSDLRDGLAEVRSAIPKPVPVDTERLQALEERVAQTAGHLSEIDDLLALLDSGFGELRAGITALRDADTQRITPLDDVTRVLPAVDAQPVIRVEPEPGRRHGKRSEATAHVAAVAEATEQLALRQRQLEAQMATLERISDATVKSVARASSEAAALAPVRSELTAVRDELWEHDEALARLARSVENLRRKIPTPAPAPAARKAPAAAKRAPAAKSATPAKPATRKPKKQ